MNIAIQEMSIQDYDEVFALWESSDGIWLSDTDSKESIARYLDRNPHLSFIARDGKHLVGAVLCGHDGRLGCINHLVVSKSHQHRRIGRALAEHCISALRKEGISRCLTFVFKDNHDGITFWNKIGFNHLTEIVIMSQEISKST